MSAAPSVVAAVVPEFGYTDAGGGCTIPYLGPVVESLIPKPAPGARALDVGCGNGFWVGRLHAMGYRCHGIEPSGDGVAIARREHPYATFHQRVISRDILTELGEEPFDFALSLEVVEHLYDPRTWAAGIFSALKPGGTLVCSTPYHGYLKNIAVAVAGKFDSHMSALWDGGHIKFFSRRTLGALLTEAGFTDLTFRGCGRMPYLWKGMIYRARKPA